MPFIEMSLGWKEYCVNLLLQCSFLRQKSMFCCKKQNSIWLVHHPFFCSLWTWELLQLLFHILFSHSNKESLWRSFSIPRIHFLQLHSSVGVLVSILPTFYHFLCTTFKLVDLKSTKNTVKLSVFFALLGSVLVKLLVKCWWNPPL